MADFRDNLPHFDADMASLPKRRKIRATAIAGPPARSDCCSNTYLFIYGLVEAGEVTPSDPSLVPLSISFACCAAFAESIGCPFKSSAAA